MSQASSQHTIAPAPATQLFAGPMFLIGNIGSSRTRDGHCYALQTATERLVVDPSQKGGPGDLVVVWCKKRGPVVTRRLARRAPFNTYHFCDLKTGDVFELPCNKVSAIHAVVRGMSA